MTAFEERGVNRQYEAQNAYKATKEFKKSCAKCILQGRQIECDRCSIASAHELVTKFLYS